MADSPANYETIISYGVGAASRWLGDLAFFFFEGYKARQIRHTPIENMRMQATDIGEIQEVKKFIWDVSNLIRLWFAFSIMITLWGVMIMYFTNPENSVINMMFTSITDIAAGMISFWCSGIRLNGRK
jgi:hypothetical protein